MGGHILKKKIAIFVNYNHKIGLGHIYRCINLADVFYNKIKFIFFINAKFPKLKYPSYIFNNEISKLSKINNFLKNNKYKNILFDIDNNTNSKKKILEIYNFFIKKNYNTVCWDNLSNLKCKFPYIYMPYPKKIFNIKNNYKNKYLIGTKYFFKKINKKFIFKKKISTVAVQLGGTKNLKILKKLNNYFKKNNQDIKIKFFIKNTIEIKYLYSLKYKNIQIYKNSNFLNYIDSIDLLITSGGMTKYEASSLKLPSLAICLNKIQYNLNKNINYKYGFLICKISNIEKKLKILLNEKNIRSQLHKNAIKNFKSFDEDSINKFYSILK